MIAFKSIVVFFAGCLLLAISCVKSGELPQGKAGFAPKVIYSDLDGTMLNEQSEIPPRNLAAVRRFQAQGGLFGIATGRLPDRAWTFAQALSVDLPAIFGNGAVILNADGSLLRMKAFHDVDKVKAFCERINEAGCSYIYTSIGHAESGQVRMLDGSCQAPSEAGWGVLKLRARNCKAHDALLAQVRELNGSSGCSILESGTGKYRGVSISAPGVSKAEALEHIAKLRKLRTEDMVFFGDSGNDVDALRWINEGGGRCYAMPNGTPGVLDVCPRRAPASNDQAGVGQAIEAMLAHKKERGS